MRGGERVPSGLRELVRLPRHRRRPGCRDTSARRGTAGTGRPSRRTAVRPTAARSGVRSPGRRGRRPVAARRAARAQLVARRTPPAGRPGSTRSARAVPRGVGSPSRVTACCAAMRAASTANSAPSDASARCTLSSITVRSIRSAKESASSRYAADAPGPNVMNACRARSFNRAWTASASARARARSCSASTSRPCRRSSVRRAALTSDARDRIRRWSSDTDAWASTTCCPNRSARSRAVSTGVWATATDAAPPNVDNASNATTTRRREAFGVVVRAPPTFLHRPPRRDA